MKIKTKIILLLVISIVVSLFASFIISQNTVNGLLNEEIFKYRKNEIERYRIKTQNLNDIAYKVLESAYNNCKNSKEIEDTVGEKLKTAVEVAYASIISIYKQSLDITGDAEAAKIRTLTRVRSLLRKLRYGKDNTGYFWINDLNGIMVAHPSKPQLDGKNLFDLKDKKGNYVFRPMIKVCKEKGAGFVKYWWAKPESDKIFPKISYVKLIKELGWIIGTGEYLDNVEILFKEKAIKVISKLRYGNNGYFWINDLNGVIITHPIKPHLNGKNLFDLKDKKGNYVFRPMIKVCKEKGAGFVEYWWTKPGEKEPSPKLSYVKLFKPWGWIIGTGIYTDSIKKEIQAKEKMYMEKMSSMAKKSLITFVILIVIFAGIGGYLSNRFIKPLEIIRDYVNELSKGEGDLTKKIKYDKKDEIGSLAKAFNTFIDKIQNIIIEMGYHAGLADANTDRILVSTVKLNRVSDKQTSSVEETTSAIIEMSASIKEVTGSVEKTFDFVQGLKNTINIVQDSSDEMLKYASQLTEQVSNTDAALIEMKEAMEIVNKGIEEIEETGELVGEAGEIVMKSINESVVASDTIKNAIDGVSAAIEQQTASIEQVSSNSTYTLKVTKSAQEKAELGKNSLKNVIASMHDIKAIVTDLGTNINKLEKSALNIGAITDVINEISEQTNLLALNAAIEAARAGEHGKGFAVVADEVRKLAERSAQATGEIAELIKGIQKDVNIATQKMTEGEKKVEEGSKLTEQSNKVIDEIVDANNNVLQYVSQINHATEEQALASKDIMDSVEKVIEEIMNIDKIQNNLKAAGENIIEKSQLLLNTTSNIEKSVEHQEKAEKNVMSNMELMNNIAKDTETTITELKKNIDEIIDGIPAVINGIESVKTALEEQTKASDRIEEISEENVQLSEEVHKTAKYVEVEVVKSNESLENVNKEFEKFKFKKESFLSYIATKHLKIVIDIILHFEKNEDISVYKKSPSECFAGKWLDKHGEELIKDKALLNDLIETHKKVHDKINELIDRKDRSIIKELEIVSEELSAKFREAYDRLKEV